MRLAVIALLIIAALSGCAESGDESVDAVDEHDHSTHDHDEGNETLDGVETANNTAPVAVLTADVLNGTAPLMVNLTLDGSDADGDNLTWILVGNETLEGSELPTTLNFTLDEGNHTFVFTVSDGELEHSVNLTIEVLAGAVEDLGPCGGEEEPCIIEDHIWVTVWSDGRCDAKGAQGVALYLHDRPGAGSQYGTGFVTGGGTWVYEESNGIPGLQLSAELGPGGSTLGTDPIAVEKGCLNGDTMVF